MNEAETRAEHIDPALKAAGWGDVEGSRIRREYAITLGRIEGHGRRGRSLTADYVLEYRNTKLATVEAKAWDLELTEGVGQAKDYASKLAIRYTYATNGRGIYSIDMKTGHEGEVPKYPTPDELWGMTFAEKNVWRDRFAAVPFEDRGGYFQRRYYQDIAIERVLESIAAGNDRILLTLATGTGKTFVAFQIAWKLFQSRWSLSDRKSGGEPTRRPRILFLAEPLDPEACPSCGQRPCVCERPEAEPCPDCGKRPCECPKEPCEVCGQLKCVCDKKRKIKVKLADGKARNIQHMMMTSFWHPDGTPMSSQQFMEMLFGKLPEFFENESELRTLWSAPDTRAQLLEALATEGFGHDQLAEMQRIIDADKSDLFDVLAHVAYALPTVTREVRAAHATIHIDSEFNAKQRAFLAFVLAHYVSEGVEELDQQKLTPLLRLKYHDSLSDAIADLGKAEEIGRVFAGFQKYLYQGGA